MSTFAVFFRQQTICLKNKNGLKSILVRRFLAIFQYFWQMHKNQDSYQNYIIKMTFYNMHIKFKTHKLLDKLLKCLKIDFEAS